MERLGICVPRGQRRPLVADSGEAGQPGHVEVAEEGVAPGGLPVLGPPVGGVGADEDLADGVAPDAAEEADGLCRRASAVDRPRHDGFDHPEGRLAEAAEEAVDREDLGGPRPDGEGVVDRDGRNDNAVPRLAGKIGTHGLLDVFVEQLDQQILPVPYVVVQGRRPDADLRGKPANGQLLPADPPSARGSRPDVLGAVLATAGLTLLVFGVVRTDRYAWASPVTVTTLTVAAALLAAFIHVERTTVREPLIRLGLFANRSVAGANAFNLLVGAAMASAFYFMTLYLQRVLGTGPALTGVEFLPFALGVVAGSVLAVKLGYRLVSRTILIAGGVLTATGFAWFSLISPDGTFATDVLGPSIVASVGFGLCLGPVVSIATAGVAPHETGTAAGLLNSSRQIGASLGLAALGTAAHNRTGRTTTPEALNHGYALGLTISAALLAGAALIALIALTVIRRADPTSPAGQAAR
jgi:Major Facilitator Superfamily